MYEKGEKNGVLRTKGTRLGFYAREALPPRLHVLWRRWTTQFTAAYPLGVHPPGRTAELAAQTLAARLLPVERRVSVAE